MINSNYLKNPPSVKNSASISGQADKLQPEELKSLVD